MAAQLEPEFTGISITHGALGELSVWVDGIQAVSTTFLGHPWPSTISSKVRDFLHTHIPGAPPLPKKPN